jgi:hypothetical protein
MNRFIRTLLVAIAAVAVIAVARAQDVSARSQPAIGDSAPVERAALDLTATSSSSGSEMFAGAGQSTLTIQPVVVENKPKSGGSRRPFSSIGIGVKGGLAGAGFDVATPLVPGWINLRGGASFFRYNGATFTTNNIDVNGSLKFQNASAVVDVFPFHGGFRLSGGLTAYNNTELSATLGVPAGQSFKLGNATYYSSRSDPIAGNASFKFGGRTAGRVSIGTGNMLPRKGRFAFETEFGVQFFTPPVVIYNITGSACLDSDGTDCGPVEQADVVAEQNKLQNDLTDLQYYPIVSFGFSFKIH